MPPPGAVDYRGLSSPKRVEALLGPTQTDQRRRRGLITSPSSYSVLPAVGRWDEGTHHGNVHRCPRTSRGRSDRHPRRAEPHDASAWFPVPDPHGLPSIEMLLEESRVADAEHRADAELIDLTAIEANLEAALEGLVSPSPARAEPHDAAAWLPLPRRRRPPVGPRAARPPPRAPGRGRGRGRGGRRRRPRGGRGQLGPVAGPGRAPRRRHLAAAPQPRGAPPGHPPARGGPARRHPAPPPAPHPLPPRPPGARGRRHGGAHRPRWRLDRPAGHRSRRAPRSRSWSTAPASRCTPTPTRSVPCSPPRTCTSVRATSSSPRPRSAPARRHPRRRARARSPSPSTSTARSAPCARSRPAPTSWPSS